MDRNKLLRGTIIFLGLLWVSLTVVDALSDEVKKQLPPWLLQVVGAQKIVLAILGAGFLSQYIPFLWRLRQTYQRRFPVLQEWDTSLPENVNALYVRRDAWNKTRERITKRMATISHNSALRDGQPVEQTTWHYLGFATFLRAQPATETTIGHLLTQPVELGVVGEAGAGKSYYLYRLLDAAMQPFNALEQLPAHCKVPVYLELGTWGKYVNPMAGNHLEPWLHRSLCVSYGLDPRNAQWLINAPEMLLVLDGLDEVAAEQRLDCLQAILQYSARTNSVVFSCRKQELADLLQQDADESWPSHVAVVELRPFAASQVQATIMASAPTHALAMMTALDSYQLADCITTPLLLNLFIQVFPSFNTQELAALPGSRDQEFTQLLWHRYEALKQQAFAQDASVDWAALRTTLIWIARKLDTPAGNYNSFFVEGIQPYRWLCDAPALFWGLSSSSPSPCSTSAPRTDPLDAPPWNYPLLLYYATSRLITSLILAVAIGLIIAGPIDFLAEGVLVGLLATLLTVTLTHTKAGQSLVTTIERQWTHGVPGHFVLAMGSALLLMSCCAAYEGFTVKRAEGDMLLNSTFSVTQAILGILVGLISGVVFGFRNQVRTSFADIRPIERLGFRWREAWRAGWKGALGIGLWIGVLGVGLESFFQGASLGDWLQEYLNLSQVEAGYARKLLVFLLAFGVAAPIGFTLLALLASLDTTKSLLEESEKERINSFNYGIKQSLLNALTNAAALFALILSLYVLIYLINGFQPARLLRLIMIAGGAGLIAFLWFGGFEVIQHRTLRFYLYVYGRLPFNFNRWLRTARQLAFIEKTGSRVRFIHQSLLEYYQSPAEAYQAPAPPADCSRPGLLRLLVISLVLGSAYLLMDPFWARYPWEHSKFWKGPDRFQLVVRDRNTLRLLSPAAIAVKRAGQLRVEVSGKVKLGTFLGYAGPAGVEFGFMGFEIRDAYDRYPAFHHGAVVYRRNDCGPVHALVPDSSSNPWPWGQEKPYQITLSRPVVAGEVIHFMVNDREWENNVGYFTLRCQVVPDTARQKPFALSVGSSLVEHNSCPAIR